MTPEIREDEEARVEVDTFAPPATSDDRDMDRIRGYATWLSRNRNRPARNDGAALTRVLDRLEASEQALRLADELAARVEKVQAVTLSGEDPSERLTRAVEALSPVWEAAQSYLATRHPAQEER